MELLTNPWVISFIVLSVVIGNIAALKYTANMKFGQMDKKSPPTENSEKDEQNQKDKDLH
ncbi:DUF2897 family protein [Vibrio sinaloensis]|uniref:DUF2897 family protein n=1 Tax=Photobacterium sp. (strain ATCC 43367) TaxID=379097 RepID=UPI002056C361|nr:DUF2897 family protein [Vibrio sinaloensis]UPQ87276.1 DUF2897 family protein [Vibrio sinaloensis]